MKKKHDEVIQKTMNYVGSEENVWSISSRSVEVAFSNGSENPRSPHRSRVSAQSKTVSTTSGQRKKELLLTKFRKKRLRDKNKHQCGH